MDAALATIVVAGISGFSSMVTGYITSKVTGRRTQSRCEAHQKELLEQERQRYSDPKTHYFFGKMQHYLTSVIPSLKETSDIPKIKMDMLKKFLEIKYRVFYEGMQKWAADQSEVKLTETAGYICALIREYEITARAQGIPESFVGAFTRQHEPVVVSTIESLEQIMRSTSYSDNDKENAVLDALLHSLSMTILAAEHTARNMNGTLQAELERLQHKG